MKHSSAHFLCTSAAGKTAEWAARLCHCCSPFVTFLIHEPTQSRHFHPFPYVCSGSQGPHHTTEQVIYSKGRTQLSLRHNLEHSLTIVLPLFHPVSDGRGRWRGLPSRRHARTLMVSSESARLLLCAGAHVRGEMRTSDRGQHFFPCSLRFTCRLWGWCLNPSVSAP